MRPIRKFFPKRLRDFLLGLAANAGFAIGKVTPRGIGLALFSFMGTLCYCILSRDRKLTVNNLRFIFGQEWSEKKIRAAARAVFKSMGKNLFDGVSLNTLKPEKFNLIVSHDSLDGMLAAKAGGKGAVLITAHAGCFEMLLHFFGRNGFNGVIIGRPFKNKALDMVVRKMRSGPGVEYMDRSESGRKIVRMLQEGKMLGVLLDQDTKVEGVFADFLGHAAFTPSGAVRFAMKFKIPILILLTARLDGDKHHVFITPELARVNTGDFETDLRLMVQQINDVISGHIRKFPEQWVWMHERWKTKPERYPDVS